MIYLDTSAALKALVAEDGTDDVRRLVGASEPLVSSRLLELELHTAAQRRGLPLDGIDELIARVALVSLDDGIVDLAVSGRFGLRALDALHLATALHLGGAIGAFLAFDRELCRRARGAGIPVHALAG